MATGSLPLFPFLGVQEGYEVEPAQMWLREDLDGGFSRRRLHIVGGTSRVTVNFLLIGFELQVFKAFYRKTLAEGSKPFRISLIVDLPVLSVYDATFVASPRLRNLQGNIAVQACELEVVLDPIDADADQAVLDWYANLGAKAPNLLVQLDDLVNQQMPNALRIGQS